MIKTAVVILNWNGKKYLEQFLGDVIKHSSSDDCRVYIADNGSSDDSCEYVRKEHPQASLIELNDNYGFAGGYNRALEGLEAEYYVLLNSDVMVSPGWLEPVTAYLDNEPGTAACQPKIRSHSEPEMFEHAGAAGGYIDKYGYPFCRGRLMNITEHDRGQYDDVKQVFWASGACLFIRSSAWKEAGGFDPDFFAHMEEIDLCWRINALGKKVMFIPGSVVYHVGGGTLPYESPSKIFFNFRNNLYMLYKNLPGKMLGRIMFWRMCLDAVAAFRFLAGLKTKAFANVIKAHIHYHRNKKDLRGKRNITDPDAKQYPGRLILNKSLVFSFYIKGQKTYTELLKH